MRSGDQLLWQWICTTQSGDRVPNLHATSPISFERVRSECAVSRRLVQGYLIYYSHISPNLPDRIDWNLQIWTVTVVSLGVCFSTTFCGELVNIFMNVRLTCSVGPCSLNIATITSSRSIFCEMLFFKYSMI